MSHSLCWSNREVSQQQVRRLLPDISNERFFTLCIFKRMLHDLILPHFVVSSTSVRRTRVINLKIVCLMLCCCVQCVEIYTEQTAFADNINFLFSFEETWCRIIHNYFENFMVNMFVPSQDTCKRWFWRFKSDFEVADKEQRKPPKNSKMRNCRHYWTNMIHKHINNSPSNWTLVNKMFPVGYERWKRFRGPVNWYHMSRRTDK